MSEGLQQGSTAILYPARYSRTLEAHILLVLTHTITHSLTIMHVAQMRWLLSFTKKILLLEVYISTFKNKMWAYWIYSIQFVLIIYNTSSNLTASVQYYMALHGLLSLLCGAQEHTSLRGCGAAVSWRWWGRSEWRCRAGIVDSCDISAVAVEDVPSTACDRVEVVVSE